jgi:DNA-directed RNA polymerase specialized sigma24 family protein
MSKESIIKDLSEDYIRRMRNWARADSGCDQYAMTSAYDGMADNAVYTSSMLTLSGEAQDTHLALQSVPNQYRQAVMLFWQYEGRALEWIGRRLGNIHYETVERRIRQGHLLHITELRRRTGAYQRMQEANSQAIGSASSC